MASTKPFSWESSECFARTPERRKMGAKMHHAQVHGRMCVFSEEPYCTGRIMPGQKWVRTAYSYNPRQPAHAKCDRRWAEERMKRAPQPTPAPQPHKMHYNSMLFQHVNFPWMYPHPGGEGACKCAWSTYPKAAQLPDGPKTKKEWLDWQDYQERVKIQRVIVANKEHAKKYLHN